MEFWMLFFILTALGQFPLVFSLPEIIRIGVLFDNNDDESQEVAFKHAINRINANPDVLPGSKLDAQIEKIDAQDSFKASQRVCHLMSMGVAAIFGPRLADTAAHVQSICDALEVPHIQARLDFRVLQDVYSINLYPHLPALSKAYEALVRYWGWKKFTILYENNDGLVKLKELFKNPVKSSFSIMVRQLPPDDDYHDVLRELMKRDQRHIIVDCSTDKVFQVLKQAQQVGMMTASYHYLVTSIDMDTIDLEDFSYSGTNITSLRLVNPTYPEVIKVVHELELIKRRHHQGTISRQNFTLKTEIALIFDAVDLFAKALHDLNVGQHINIKPLYCELENTSGSGQSLINYMKVVQLTGLSGIVGFDTNGFRSHFDLDIMELHKMRLEKIGNWSSRYQGRQEIKGLTLIKKTETKDDGSLRSIILNVTTLMSPPYAMKKDHVDPLSGNDRYEGYCIDLINEIAKILHLNYTIYVVQGNSHGKMDNVTNTWNGIIGDIIEKKADLGLGDITITLDRQRVVDFSTPFMSLGINILFRKPARAPPSLLSFLSPFSSTVWLYMAITYMGVSLILFVLARLSPYEWDNPHPCIQEPDVLHNDFGILNSMWFTIGSLMQQGSDIAPKAASTRLVAGIWWFFTLIIISSYTANLAAFLTVENLESPIKDVYDLARQTNIKCGSMEGGSTSRFFEQSNISVYKQIWSRMSVDGLVKSNEEGKERVERGGYAFFMESTSNEYLVERSCELARVGGLLDTKHYGIALPKDSPYRNNITIAILQLMEKGELARMKTKWWKQKKKEGGQCPDDKGGSTKPLGLSHVGGIFLVLVSGMGLACIIAVTEFIWKRGKVSSFERDSLCQEMIKELTFAVKCKGSKKVTKKMPSEPENGVAMPLSKYSFGEREMYS